MKVTSYGKSDIGRKRTSNQDSILVNNKINFYAVADGMGGHRGGETASAMALEIVGSAIEKMSDRSSSIQVAPFIKEAISLASMKIFERSLQEEDLKGMGTTLVGLYISGNTAYIAQVGDSRVYLYKDSLLWKVTEDHSLINEQVRAGIISKDDAEKLNYRNVITRSVGFEEMVAVDVYTREIESGDIFILCSDGLTCMLKDQNIRHEMDPNDIKGSVDRLISISNELGGSDNISVVMVKVD